MKSELPKVLHNLLGKPLITHVIDNIRSTGVEDVIAVVGYKGEDVKARMGESVTCVWQHEQLGTGHAVLQARDSFKDFKGSVIVACGDAPLISSHSFRLLIESMSDGVGAVVLTMEKDDPKGYGRIVRNKEGNFSKIVEEKDADSDVKMIQEVNSGTYIFKADLLLSGLESIGNDNAQKEYYLPDVLGYVLSKGFSVKTVILGDPFEGSGINSREELEAIEMELQRRDEQ